MVKKIQRHNVVAVMKPPKIGPITGLGSEAIPYKATDFPIS
jgi:hypothetical protein